MVNEDRPDEVVVPLVLLAQGGALLLGILHQALNEVGTALTDHWGDGTVVLQQPQVCEACKAGKADSIEKQFDAVWHCQRVLAEVIERLHGIWGALSVVLNCMQEGKLGSV